jgi:hypothetical protein
MNKADLRQLQEWMQIYAELSPQCGDRWSNEYLDAIGNAARRTRRKSDEKRRRKKYRDPHTTD